LANQDDTKFNGPKYHTAALDIILKKKTFCIDLGMSSHSSMVHIFYFRSQKSMQNVFFFKIISNAAVWYFGPLNFPFYLDCHCTIGIVQYYCYIAYNWTVEDKWKVTWHDLIPDFVRSPKTKDFFIIIIPRVFIGHLITIRSRPRHSLFHLLISSLLKMFY
jgi:hypothetical protein